MTLRLAWRLPLLARDELGHHVADLLLEFTLRGARREVAVRDVDRVPHRLDPREDLRTALRVGLDVAQEIHMDVPRLGVREPHLLAAVQHVLHRPPADPAPDLDLRVPD